MSKKQIRWVVAVAGISGLLSFGLSLSLACCNAVLASRKPVVWGALYNVKGTSHSAKIVMETPTGRVEKVVAVYDDPDCKGTGCHTWSSGWLDGFEVGRTISVSAQAIGKGDVQATMLVQSSAEDESHTFRGAIVTGKATSVVRYVTK